jgi:phenylpyruvate tautomerase PptA (4-oxalocrotonate tautomerase family)
MHNSVKLTDESKSVLINDIDNDGFGEGGKNYTSFEDSFFWKRR